MVTQLLTFSANKQADGEKNNRLQDATDLQQITANEASGGGSLPVIEKAHCKSNRLATYGSWEIKAMVIVVLILGCMATCLVHAVSKYPFQMPRNDLTIVV
jgi:hypothetical protein